MFRIIAVIGLALALSGCAEFAKIQQIYTVATTTTVPAEVVRPAANTFDILKGTAANFARYCIGNQFTGIGCDAGTRRKIVKFVNQGTKARIALRSSVEIGQPALSTIYNLLVGAVTGLQGTPVATFTGK